MPVIVDLDGENYTVEQKLALLAHCVTHLIHDVDDLKSRVEDLEED